MTEWNELEDAYGPATEVQDLLARLSPDPRAEVWDELWGRICHQGSVYSASFASIPHLTRAAASWKPQERPMVLTLASAIFAGDDQSPGFAQMRMTYAAELSTLRDMTAETLRTAGMGEEDFIYVLQAMLAFDGIRPWGTILDRLSGAEFEATCPSCETLLFVAIGGDGFFTSVEDYALKEDVKKGVLHAAQRSEFSVLAERLHRAAISGGQPHLAESLAYLFGTAECAQCGEAFSLPEAIEREYRTEPA